jgi:hypothetical protein
LIIKCFLVYFFIICYLNLLILMNFNNYEISISLNQMIFAILFKIIYWFKRISFLNLSYFLNTNESFHIKNEWWLLDNIWRYLVSKYLLLHFISNKYRNNYGILYHISVLFSSNWKFCNVIVRWKWFLKINWTKMKKYNANKTYYVRMNITKRNKRYCMHKLFKNN